MPARKRKAPAPAEKTPTPSPPPPSEGAAVWERVLGTAAAAAPPAAAPAPDASDAAEDMFSTMASTSAAAPARLTAHLDLLNIGRLLMGTGERATKELFITAAIAPAIEADPHMTITGAEVGNALLAAAVQTDNGSVRAGLLTAYGMVLESRTLTAASAGGLNTIHSRAALQRALVARRGRIVDFNAGAVAVALQGHVADGIIACLPDATRPTAAPAVARGWGVPSGTEPPTGARWGGARGGGSRRGRFRGGRLPPS